jgi:hypothetical protein
MRCAGELYVEVRDAENQDLITASWRKSRPVSARSRQPSTQS